MNELHSNCWDLYEKAMREATCKVAIDIGSNLGGYTFTLLQHGFKVLCYEPVPRMFNSLIMHYAINPNVVLNQIALSDRDGVIENCQVMHAWTLGDPKHVGMSISPDFTGEPPFRMELRTLDGEMSRLAIEKVGIIKLDCDGYEYRVLKGAGKTIRRDLPPILCEFSEYVERLGDSPKDFVNFIFDLGYRVVSLDGKMECRTWEEVEPYFPRPHSKVIGSFDVLLLPR